MAKKRKAGEGAEEQPEKGKPRRRRWLRRLGITSLVGIAAVLGLWIAANRIPWVGATLADGLRAVVGPGPVAWLQDVAYGVQDRINRWRYKNTKPKTFWDAPAKPPVLEATATKVVTVPPFQPKAFKPPFDKVSTPADGVWVPIVDVKAPKAPPVMHKTMVHPDKTRGFAALAVIAMDPRALDLHLVAGTSEPQSMRVRRADRPGMVPASHRDKLFAAFNGGFKTTHGQYGMMLKGVEYLPPRGYACTFVRFKDGSFAIGTWDKLKKTNAVSSMRFYRQTPPCLVEDGALHKALHYHEYAKGWGATISGDTVIRRSAIGLDKERKVLFYGLGEGMTARSIAVGMRAAGAHWVAELDVNYSYPRFLFYERKDPARPPVATSAIIPGLKYPKDQYVSRPSVRDFFYLTRIGKKTSRLTPPPPPAASSVPAASSAASTSNGSAMDRLATNEE